MTPELQALLTSSIIDYSPMQIIFNLAITLVLGLVVFWTYKKTYTGVLYSRSFNLTILLITLVTSMVIMIIGGNLSLSLGMVGALSIIRFRSAIKDPRDIGFLFWGIALGLASGSNAYTIAVIGTCLIALVLLISRRKAFDDSIYLAIIKGTSLQDEVIENVIETHTTRYRLKMRNRHNQQTEIIYEVKLKEGHLALTEALEAIDDQCTLHLVTYNGETNG